jgi:hypothetical protein
VAGDADAGTRVEVHREDLRWRSAHPCLDVLTEEHPRLLVVGGEGGIDNRFRLGCGVERDHDHALLPGRLDGAEHPAGAARRDEDAAHALPHQILDRGHLPLVVAVEPAGEGEHLCAVSVGGGSCRITQLDEVRVGLRLRNETDLDRPAFPGAGAATPMALRGTPREHQQDEEQCRRYHASRADE